MNERWRRAGLVFGVVLWAAYPFIFNEALSAERNWRCAGRSFTGHFDDCFNDMLPVFELGVFVLTALLGYPFARLAAAMFAPSPKRRSRRWRLAAKDQGAAYFPAFQIAAAIGVLWAALHLRSIPLVPSLWFAILYWCAWIGWFFAGSYAASPLAELRPKGGDVG